LIWRSGKVSRLSLVFLAVVGLIVVAVVEATRSLVPQPYFEEKLAAARLSKQMFAYIRSYQGKRVTVSHFDPYATGLIGDQFTPITTSRGDLGAKLSTVNPNIAAAVVDQLKSAGVKSGDYVAIGMTGSYPALNIAVLAACQVLGVVPIIITSVGSSMWGATDPDFTWLDMESYLAEKEVLRFRSTAASIGGRYDNGANITEEGRELILSAIKRNGVRLVYEPTLQSSIDERMRIYRRSLPLGKEYALYINIGGGVASIGAEENLTVFPFGITRVIPDFNFPVRGVMVRFLTSGVPVLNLSDVPSLIENYKFPRYPFPVPSVPSGDVFFRMRYNLPLTAVLLAFYLLLVFVVIRLEIYRIFFFLRKKTNLNSAFLIR